MRSVLRLIVRSGCHLCDDMLEALRHYQKTYDFDLEIIDIMEKPLMEDEFGSRIPVLMHEENFICEYFLDVKTLMPYISENRN